MLLAIDPGEVHIGVARFRRGAGGRKPQCDWAQEIKPAELILMLESEVPFSDGVVCEEFRLYPWRMAQQGFAQMKTSELIGVIKYICDKRGMKLFQQPASIKEPTERILKAMGIALKSHGHGPHAKDAEIHGYWFFRDLLEKE